MMMTMAELTIADMEAMLKMMKEKNVDCIKIKTDFEYDDWTGYTTMELNIDLFTNHLCCGTYLIERKEW